MTSEVFVCMFLTGFDYKCSQWHRILSWCWQYYKWHHLEYLHLFWQHGSPATEGDIGKVTDYGGWTCKYKEDLSFVASLSGMKLRLVMMKFHKCCCINTNDKYFYFSRAQSVFPCNCCDDVMWKWDWLLTFLFSGMSRLWTFLIVVHGTWHEQSNKLRLTPEATSD